MTSSEKDQDYAQIEDDEAIESEEGRRAKGVRWRNLSYAARVTISFSLIAAMTALVAIGVVSVVWEQYFHEYTQDNMSAVAETTAEQIATRYAKAGKFDDSVLQPASNAITVYRGVGMQVVDADNKVLFDSTTLAIGEEGIVPPSIATVSSYGYCSFLNLENPKPQLHAAECFLALGDKINAASSLEALNEYCPKDTDIGREYRAKAAKLRELVGEEAFAALAKEDEKFAEKKL